MRGDVPRERGCRNRVPFPGEVVQEGVPHRRLREPPFERESRPAALGKATDGPVVLGSQDELDLPELIGLEPARGFQPRAKRQELQWRHRLEDIELHDEHLQDRQDSLQRVLCAVGIVGGEQPARPIQLVQQLLEPEFVHLVDDDEEELVVFEA